MNMPEIRDVNTLDMKMEDVEFLHESNLIEREESMEALEDAVLAWDFLRSRDVLDLDSILGAHYLLMHRLKPKIAGKIRDCAVWVGKSLKMFPSIDILRSDIVNWLRDCNAESKLWTIQKTEEKEAAILRWHLEFEDIHPFEDGNGRIGRMLMNVQRIKFGLEPITIFSGEDQARYYELFAKKTPLEFIREHGVYLESKIESDLKK